MTITSKEKMSKEAEAKQPLPFFRLAFRPFFWLGALFSVLSISVWGLSFTGHLEFTPYGGAYFWHIHEMLFGFTAAIICGFLLTAVQNWTGIPSITGIKLSLLVSIWLAARFFLAFPFSIPDHVITLLDVLFLPLSSVFIAIPVIKAKKWRNLIFVPILLLMSLLNGLMHLSTLGVIAISFVNISHIMVLMVTLVMCVIAGRVFPMFTANGTHTVRVAPLAWLEKLSIISVLASILVTTQLLALPSIVEACIYLIAGLSNFTRALRWRIWVTLKTPLVWPLHLSYWALCLGLFMLGLEKLTLLTNTSLAYHSITVGGTGLMVLAMISRVSLGHTGRELHVGKIMTCAFTFIALAFISRVLAPLLLDAYSTLILLASALWVIAYSIFVVVYCPVLFSSHVDGGKG